MIERHAAFQSPELPMPGIADAAPFEHVDGGHGEDPFLVIPPLLVGRSQAKPDTQQQGPDAAATPFATLGVAAANPFIAAVLACRREQADKWGHTPQADAAQPVGGFLDHMLREAVNRAHGALEHHQARTGLGNVRKYAVTLAAVCHAVVDRIDLEATD